MKKEYLIMFAGLFIILSIIFAVFYGTPWTKYITKKNAQVYLDNKYTQKMIIADGWYNFKEGNYYFTAHPVGLDNLSFRVHSLETNKEFGDLYLIRLWEEEVNSQLVPFVNRLYSNNARIRMNISNSIDYLPKSRIPKYDDVKDKIGYTDMYMFVQNELTELNELDEFEKIHKLIQFIKEKTYYPSEIRIYYKGSTDKIDTYGFNIKYSDLQNINSPQDIEKYKN